MKTELAKFKIIIIVIATILIGYCMKNVSRFVQNSEVILLIVIILNYNFNSM